MLPWANHEPPASRRAPGKFLKGFTSVELMVAIALLGVTLALALPSYREMAEKRQLTQGAEQIAAFVNSVQGIAARSNSEVTVSYTRVDNDDWCIGAVLGSTKCDCMEAVSTESDYCSIDGSNMRLTNDHVGNTGVLAAVSGDGEFTFEPVRGLMADLNDSLDMTLHSPGSDYQIRFIVSNTGHSVLCSVDADHKVPGYKLCPP